MNRSHRSLLAFVFGASLFSSIGKLHAEAQPEKGIEASTSYEVTLHDPAGVDLKFYVPRDKRVEVGSHPNAFIFAEKLSGEHAQLKLDDDTGEVFTKDGVTYINGTSVESSALFTHTDQVIFEPYILSWRAAPIINVVSAATTASAWRSEEFERTVYAFCHDEDFQPKATSDSAYLCKLFDASTTDVCPAATKSCPWNDSAHRKPPWLNVPPMLVRLVLLSILVGLVGWFVIAVLRAGWEDEFRAAPVGNKDAEDLDLQKLPEARGQVLLRRASDAFRSGDAQRAAFLAHLAILRHLDDSGLVRFHPSKTNGDYARAIRGHINLYKIFRQISRQTERIRFGDGIVDPAEIEQVLKDAPNELDKRTGGSSGVSAALLLVSAAVGASGCSDALNRPYYSHAPNGMTAMIAMLRSTGLDVEVGRWKWANVPDAGVYVLRTSAAVNRTWPDTVRLDDALSTKNIVIIDEGLRTRLITESHPGAVSVDRPRRQWQPSVYSNACWPQSLANAKLDAVTTVSSGGFHVTASGFKVSSPAIEGALKMMPVLAPTETSTSGPAYIWAGQLEAEQAEADASRGCLFVVHQRGLLTNASLTRPENAAFVAAWLTAAAGFSKKVVFVDRLDPRMGTNEADASNAGQIFIASNMLPLLLQSFLTLMLIIIAVGAAFGPLRDDITQPHKAFVEHVEALGRHYAQSGNRGRSHSATILARFVVMQYRHRLRGGQSGGWQALVQELSDKHELPPEDIRAALRLGTEGVNELGSPDPADPPPYSERILNVLTTLLASRDAGQPSTDKSPVFGQRPSSPE